MGADVSLYNRSAERIKAIQFTGGIELLSDVETIPTGFANISIVTTDIREAIEGRDILMVVVPASGHRFIAEQLAPHIEDGQIIVLNPGRTGGALEVLNILRNKNASTGFVVCEAQTLIYASRAINPAQTRIFRIKNSIPVAAIPAHLTPEIIKKLRTAYPQFVPGDNVMKTSLDNIGAVFHPVITVLNAARIESTNGDFDFYTEGITSSVAAILECIDKERVTIAESLGFRAMTAREWLYTAYDASGRTLFEAIRSNRGYDDIKAPKTIFNRYITEDIPMSLVPLAALGSLGNVPTPTIDAIIMLGSILHKVDYAKAGRSLKDMGLENMNLKNIRRYVLEGEL